jgi:hypothetical protein
MMLCRSGGFRLAYLSGSSRCVAKPPAFVAEGYFGGAGTSQSSAGMRDETTLMNSGRA